jgi:hypothetical protein
MSTQTTFTPAEKASVVTSYASILASKEILDEQAVEHGIDLEKITLDDAIDALTAYLEGNAGWPEDATEDMAIDPAEYNAAFDTVFNAIRALQVVIATAVAAAEAAKVATPDSPV